MSSTLYDAHPGPGQWSRVGPRVLGPRAGPRVLGPRVLGPRVLGPVRGSSVARITREWSGASLSVCIGDRRSQGRGQGSDTGCSHKWVLLDRCTEWTPRDPGWELNNGH